MTDVSQIERFEGAEAPDYLRAAVIARKDVGELRKALRSAGLPTTTSMRTA